MKNSIDTIQRMTPSNKEDNSVEGKNIQNSIEEKKEQVVQILRKYSDKIDGFDVFTYASNGFASTNMANSSNINHEYKEHWPAEMKDTIEIKPFGTTIPDKLADLYNDKNSYYINNNMNSYYIFNKKENRIIFNAMLGRTHDRPGNILLITFRFNKNDTTDKTEFLEKIIGLLKTVGYHYDKTHQGAAEDRYKIAKEILPVLEAFKEIEQKHRNSARSSDVTIDTLINYHKKLIENNGRF